MTLTADLFFSFRSPYSYLSVGRYRALAETQDVNIVLRPVYPLAIRQPEFFAEGNKMAGQKSTKILRLPVSTRATGEKKPVRTLNFTLDAITRLKKLQNSKKTYAPLSHSTGLAL